MTDYLSPGSYTRRKLKGNVVSRGFAATRGAMMGLCEKGPIGKPTYVISDSNFKEVFGDSIDESFLAAAVSQYFNNGGEALYVSRVEHYTDPTNAATLEAIASTSVLNSGTGAASPASVTSNASTFPVSIPPGTVFDGSVGGVGSTGFTIQATPATITLTGGTYAAGAANDALTFTVAGWLGTQTVDLSAVAGTRQAYIDALNTQLVGLKAVASGGSNIQILTDTKGSFAAANITAIGGAAAAKAGATVAAFTNAGPNNVSDSSFISAEEFASLMNTGFTGTTSVATAGSTRVQVSTTATGGSASFAFSLPSNIATLIPGFDLVTRTGAAAGGQAAALTVEASSEGAWGNAQKVTTKRVNTIVAKTTVTPSGAVTSLVLSSVGRIAVGDTFSLPGPYRSVVTAVDPGTKRITFSPAITLVSGLNGSEDVTVETLNMSTTDKNGVVQQPSWQGLRMSPLAGDKFIENAVNATPNSAIKVTVANLAPSATVDPRPLDVTNQYLGSTTLGVSAISSITDADFIGSEAGKTGLHAFDDTTDFLLFAAPGLTSVAILKGIEAYADNRGDIFVISEVPKGLQGTAARTFVESTANLATRKMAIYTPWVKATDVKSGVATFYPPSGMVMGMYARTFRLRNIGKAPAGIIDGRLVGALGVEYDIRKPTYDILYPARINAIQNKPGKGVVVFGSRTLDATGEFGQVSVEIVFTVVERLFDDLSQFTVFENNNPTTRATLVRNLSSILRDYRVKGILQGESDDEAFFIICDETNNTPSVIASNRIVCRVGLAVEEPGEFVETTLERDTRARDAELASEQEAV